MRRIMLLLLMVLSTMFISTIELIASCNIPAVNSDDDAGTPVLSENDTYLDLNTGKVFTIMFDDLNSIYNREDMFAFDLYVNTRTRDTFWLEDAVKVNNALVRDGAGNYRVDPMKVKRDGAGYKVINNKAVKKPVPHENADKPAESDASAM